MPVIPHECRHIMPTGARCQSMALRNKPYCHFHNRLYRFTAALPARKPIDTFRLPILKDRSAMKAALAQVHAAVASARLDPRRVGLSLYALHIASQNVNSDSEVTPPKPLNPSPKPIPARN